MERDLLARRPALLGGDIGTFDDLFRTIAQAGSERHKVATDAQRALVLRRALAGASLNGLGSSARFSGFGDALLGAISELESSFVDPGEVEGDLAVLFTAYLGELERLQLFDRDRDRAYAVARVETELEAWDGRPVLAYGFEDLTGAQWALLRALAGRAEVHVSLPYEPGRPAFASLRRTADDLAGLADGRVEELPPAYAEIAHPALAHLERALFADGEHPEPPPLEGAVRFLEGAGSRGALELVADEVLDLLRDGTPAEAIGLVCPSLDRLRAPLETALAGAGIPYAIEGQRTARADALRPRAPLGAPLPLAEREPARPLRLPSLAVLRPAARVGRLPRGPSARQRDPHRHRGEGRRAPRPAAAGARRRPGRPDPDRGGAGARPRAAPRCARRGVAAGGRGLAPRPACLGGGAAAPGRARGLARAGRRARARRRPRRARAADGAPRRRGGAREGRRARPPARADAALRGGLRARPRGGQVPAPLRPLAVPGRRRPPRSGRPRSAPASSARSRSRASATSSTRRARGPSRRLYLVREAASDDGAPRLASPFWDEARALFDPADVARWTRRRPLSALTWPLDEAPTERERLRALASLAVTDRPGAEALAAANGWERRLQRARTRLRPPDGADQPRGARRRWRRGRASTSPSSRPSPRAPRSGSWSGSSRRARSTPRSTRSCAGRSRTPRSTASTPACPRRSAPTAWRRGAWRRRCSSCAGASTRRSKASARSSPTSSAASCTGSSGATWSASCATRRRPRSRSSRAASRSASGPSARRPSSSAASTWAASRSRGRSTGSTSTRSAPAGSCGTTSRARLRSRRRRSTPSCGSRSRSTCSSLRDLVGIEPLGGLYRALAGEGDARGLLRATARDDGVPGFQKNDYRDEDEFWGQIDRAAEHARGFVGRIRSGDVAHDPLGDGGCPSWCDLAPICRVRRP